MEKLAEERTFTQNIPFTDRIDYLAAMSNNLAYCLAVEQLCDIEVPPRAQAIRLLFAELQRLASHAMANGTFANDCGTWQTPSSPCFRERERILDMFEMTCGARLHTNYMRIGGVAFDLPDELSPPGTFLHDMPQKIEEYRDLLIGNEILVARARESAASAPKPRSTPRSAAPVLRGSGVPWDLRKADPIAATSAWTSTSPWVTTATATTASSCAWKRCASPSTSSDQVVDNIPGGPGSPSCPSTSAARGRGLRPASNRRVASSASTSSATAAHPLPLPLPPAQPDQP